MSKFFEKVKFEDPKDFGVVKPKTVAFWDRDKLKTALKEILEEIEKIRHGTSEFTSRAIDPGRFGFPAENSIKIFVKDPSDKSFEGVREICKQDFMARAGNHFYNLLKACRSEVNNE